MDLFHSDLKINPIKILMDCEVCGCLLPEDSTEYTCNLMSCREKAKKEEELLGKVVLREEVEDGDDQD